jgi:enoyl-CoA hydratase
LGSIDLSWRKSIAQIEINRPLKRNALSLVMWEALSRCFSEISRAEHVTAVILRGAGEEAFAAGADILELESCVGSSELGERYMDVVERAESAIAECAAPTIAMIKGYCIGAGLEIAMACDLRIATEDSKFAAPPAKLGANYSHSSTRRLVELVRPSGAKDLLFTGRRVGAPEALRLGLIDKMVSRETIAGFVEDYVRTLAANSRYSIGVAKRTVEEVRDGATTESDHVRRLRSAGFSHPDMREGLAAFREGRKPQYIRQILESPPVDDFAADGLESK